jgi:hypothetical protein
MAAVATAVTAKSRLAQAVRFLPQIRKCIAASVRHADAIMDQTIVTQLMLPGSTGQAPEMDECGVPSKADPDGESRILGGGWYARTPWAVKRAMVRSGSAP